MTLSPGEKILDTVRDQIADVLRRNIATLNQAQCVDGNDDPVAVDALLGDWLMIIQFVGLDGEDGTFRLSSHGLSGHGRAGLAKILFEEC